MKYKITRQKITYTVTIHEVSEKSTIPFLTISIPLNSSSQDIPDGYSNPEDINSKNKVYKYDAYNKTLKKFFSLKSYDLVTAYINNRWTIIEKDYRKYSFEDIKNFLKKLKNAPESNEIKPIYSNYKPLEPIIKAPEDPKNIYSKKQRIIAFIALCLLTFTFLALTVFTTGAAAGIIPGAIAFASAISTLTGLSLMTLTSVTGFLVLSLLAFTSFVGTLISLAATMRIGYLSNTDPFFPSLNEFYVAHKPSLEKMEYEQASIFDDISYAFRKTRQEKKIETKEITSTQKSDLIPKS